MKAIVMAALLSLACLAGAGLQAESDNALYLLAGPDVKVLSNPNTNGYFNNSNTTSTTGYADGVVHLGLQMQRWAALEASADFGPYRKYDVTYDDGLLTHRQATASWGMSTYSIMPAATWVGPGWISLLGFRVGLANLYNENHSSDAFSSSSYTQDAQTVDFGLLYRSSAIFVGHFNLGLELGYDWTKFNNVRNVDGNPSTLDFSGFHAALVLGLWSNPILANDRDSDRDQSEDAN